MIPAVLGLLLAVSPSPAVGGVTLPPDAVFEPELTKAANARAQVEAKAALARLEQDRSIPSSAKAEIRKKIERLKVAVYTSPRSLDETVAYFEQTVSAANFLFGERPVLDDAAEVARAGGFSLPQTAVESWSGKRGRTARWSRDDGSLEVDVEDHLIDPRDATIRKQTVVLLTTTQ